jgi:hypothetical protein
VLPERHVRDWILDTLAWLLRELAGALPWPRPLLLPNDAFFPVSARLPPEERAARLFDCLARHVGPGAPRCEIAPLASLEPADTGLPLVFVAAEPEPAALFERGLGAGPHRIHYHPELLADPMRLVAILSHGLAHALLVRVQHEPPGGDEARDAVTDLAAVWLGAGVFLANSALSICRDEALLYEGLAVRCQGWLGQGDFAFALAVFLHVFPQPRAEVAAHLRPGPRLEFEGSRGLLARPEHRAALARVERLARW